MLRYSTRTSHPLFYNQLYARIEPAALAAEWAAAATNTNVHTYEVAPVYTLLENEVIAKMAAAVGFPEDARDGLLVPGGSASNLYALHLARHRAFPDSRRKGLAACPPLVAFTSAHSHYSYTKASGPPRRRLRESVGPHCGSKGVAERAGPCARRREWACAIVRAHACVSTDPAAPSMASLASLRRRVVRRRRR